MNIKNFVRTSVTELKKIVLNNRIQHYCCYHQKEFLVPTFCNIFIKVPYNVKITPLDVHQYHNCDKLILKVICNSETVSHSFLSCDQNGNNIKISGTHCNGVEQICIKAPVKANLDIETTKGDIDLAHFNSDEIVVVSQKGNITINKFHGEKISLSSSEGTINLSGVIQAAEISAEVLKKGSIMADRLQGLKVNLNTNFGNISVKSSYCNESVFHTCRGDLFLSNIHKNCQIIVKEKGNISLASLDGNLNLLQSEGSSDLYITRILEDSVINIHGSGHLSIKLSEECQENTRLEIKSTENSIDKSVILLKSLSKDNTIYLTPILGNHKTIKINSQSTVSVEGISWIEMMKKQLKV